MTAETEEKFENLVWAASAVVENAFPICTTTHSECNEYVINADAYLALVQRLSDLQKQLRIEGVKTIIGDTDVDEC